MTRHVDGSVLYCLHGNKTQDSEDFRTGAHAIDVCFFGDYPIPARADSEPERRDLPVEGSEAEVQAKAVHPHETEWGEGQQGGLMLAAELHQA